MGRIKVENSMKSVILAFAAAGVVFTTTPTFAADQVKFGKTCVSTPNNASDVCVSFDGKTASSTYKHQKQYPTQGKHTGCTTSESAIKCSGGTWSSGGNSGAMGPITIKLSKAKPVSLTWGQ